MGSLHSIKLVKNIDIDAIKYDNCIKDSVNGSVCAFAWYINCCTSNWSTLVLDDYKAVMPFCYELNSIVMPSFILWLGVFSQHKITSAEVDTFINAIANDYRLTQMRYNKFCIPKQSDTKLKFRQIRQFDMIYPQPIRALYYSPKAKMSLLQSEKDKMQVHISKNTDVFMAFVKKYMSFDDILFNRLGFLIKTGIYEDACELFFLEDQNNKVVGVCAALFSNHDIQIPILNVCRSYNQRLGKILLIDSLLNKFSERNLTLYIDPLLVDVDDKIISELGGQQFQYLAHEKDSFSKLKELLGI